MPQTMQGLMQQYVSNVRAIYGSHLRQIILYGSYARGDYNSDSDVDIMTARNSGLPCISVTWGFRDEELQRSMGTDYIIHKPEELLEVLDGRNQAC